MNTEYVIHVLKVNLNSNAKFLFSIFNLFDNPEPNNELDIEVLNSEVGFNVKREGYVFHSKFQESEFNTAC